MSCPARRGETQAVFLPVCDHQRRLLLPTDGDAQVLAAPGFAVIVAFNPGTGDGLIEALHSRMSITVDVPSHYQVAETLGLGSPYTDLVSFRPGGRPVPG